VRSWETHLHLRACCLVDLGHEVSRLKQTKAGPPKACVYFLKAYASQTHGVTV
jgi:hypothetical protein